MRLIVIHRLAKPASPGRFLARHAWKLGLGLVVIALLTARGAGQTYTQPHSLATNVTPTTVPCGAIKLDATSTDTATWTAVSSPYGTGSPYILPSNDPNLPTTDPTHPNCLKPDPSTPANSLPDDIRIAPATRLVIDGSQGPVQIFSHGTGIVVNGGEIQTINTSATNTVSFDAEPDVPSWGGITIVAADAGHKGDASFSYVSLQHALTAITITSGALSSPDSGSYGLTVSNSGIGPSYFDGIDAVNTPISITGRVDPITGRSDGQFGTLNNIGSQGIKLTFDPNQPDYPAVIPAKSLDVENMTFGSSVPFGETNCLPLTSCAAGTIGNDAIQATFAPNAQEPVLINNNQFFRAGSYGLELNNPNKPVLTSNSFSHNGIGSSEPTGTCPKNAVNKYPPIYLNNATVDLENSVTANFGQQDGLEAIVFNGTVSSPTFTWKTAGTDPMQPLGYLLDGDLGMVGGTFKVPGGSVVKAKHGTLNLNGVRLDANDAGAKTFTSLRDSSVGIDAVCSVFVQSGPPSPLPSGDWGGINLLNGADASINNSTILYGTDGVQITDGATSTLDPSYGANYGLVIRNSQVGASFFDTVSATRTPIAVVATQLACPVGACSGPSAGHDGVFADFTGSGTLGRGLLLDSNTVGGSVNEAIRGVSLGKQKVVVIHNTIRGAGTFGIKLEGASAPTITGNDVRNSGTGSPSYSAIYLPDLVQGDFSSAIAGNTGGTDGLNAIVFHGSTANAKPLNWQTVGASNALAYIVDGDLTVNGDLTLVNGDYAPVLGGTITVKSGTVTANGATFTSLKQQRASLPSCGSVFVQKVSGACPPPAAGDWGGLVLDPGGANAFTSSEIGYAATGISLSSPSLTLLAQNLTLTQTSIHHTTADGVRSQSPLAISGGRFTSNGGHGVNIALVSASLEPVSITGNVALTGSGLDGILATGLDGQVVQIQDATIDHSGGYGIDLVGAAHLTLTNNIVTNSAPSFAAIYLNGFKGAFAGVSGNRGAGNGLDALALHGTVTDDLTWQTARKSNDPTKLLGYLLDGDLNMSLGHTLEVKAGDIVKVGNGGAIRLNGGKLKADDTGSSSQKVFTSLGDDSVGVHACGSALLPGCVGPTGVDWGGIQVTNGNANPSLNPAANGALLNTTIRYALTGILIDSMAGSTFGSSTFGLVVSHSSVGPTGADAIVTKKTPISVTDSIVSGASHGINADLTNAQPGIALRFSGNRFQSTSAEAILGQALAGQPVWITDNHVLSAGRFGIRLLGADELVLRNNNISNSGGGPSAGAAGYPAIYLNGVVADFTRNVRGNVGSGNALDVIAFHGTANSDLSWQTPMVNAATGALGYVLDGSLTVSDGTLTVHPGDVVKSLGGPITVTGGALDASNVTDPRTKIFTSLKDQTAYPQTCPSVLTGLCASGPQPGDWGGIVITNDSSGQPGSASLVNGQLSFAATALTIDSGPTANFRSSGAGLIVKGTTISDATADGINAQDTKISVGPSTTIQRVGVHGIVATFFGGTPCASACGTSLDIEHVTITTSGKDGVVASGLGGRPTVISDNLVSGAGTYGIRLAGADQLSLNRNTVNSSGGPLTTFRYPAVYLSAVKADFELKPGTTTVAGNHGAGNGLDAMVVHGEATQPLTWLTTGVTAPVAVPPVPADHFGYLLDGGLTVDGMLKTNAGDIVKVLGGTIQVNGALLATSTTFTSLKDASFPIAVCSAGYDSVFLQKASGSCPAAASGDWAGINATAGTTLTNVGIGFDDGLTVSGGALQYAGGAMHDIAHNAIAVSGASLSVTNVAFSGVGNDGIDGTNSGHTDTITDNQFDHVGGIAINLQTSPADLQRNVFTNDGSPAVKTSGAAVTIECSSLQSGGITADAQLTVKESDFSTGVGVTAFLGASAENNWWGQATGPSGQLSGGVAVSTYFTTQNPAATITIAGEPSATQPLDPVKSNVSAHTS